jgi:hypothetical protein
MPRTATARWIHGCLRIPRRRVERWAQRYPARRVPWKKTMQPFQTAGVPPRSGSSIRAKRGCTQKRSRADVNEVAANRIGTCAPSFEVSVRRRIVLLPGPPRKDGSARGTVL